MEKLKLEDLNIDNEFNFDEVYKECFVDINKEMSAPPIAMGIGYHTYKDKEYLNPTFTYGETSVLVAPQKSKKSFFKAALAASYIGGKASNYFPNIVSCREGNRYVLDFDTEQGEFYCLRIFRTVCEMVGTNYPYYFPFSLKKKLKKERLRFIDEMLKKHSDKAGIAFIDGIKDLITNFNDPVESDRFMGYVEEWTSLGWHICEVIHKTFDKEKARGHQGTIALEKCETSIFLEITDKETKNSPVKVMQKDSRGAPFDDFYFDLDLNNLIPKVCEQTNW